MTKSIRKPTGSIGPLHVSAQGIQYQQIEFPKTKEEIEEFIVRSFVNNYEVMPLQITSYRQNHQDDFDFIIETSNGTKYLELMEIAPLENLRGSYEKAPCSYKPYDFAKFIYKKLNRKSERYRGSVSSRICLLIYITDWAFTLSDTIIALLQYWTAHHCHSFEYIFYYSPLDQVTGVTHLVYPTPVEFWETFNPEAYREKIVHNLSPLEWKHILT